MEERFVHEGEERESFLQGLKNHIIDVIVLGSWLFTGKLVEIEDEQVVLCEVTVTACGGLTLSTFEVPRVVICLDTIISVGKPALLAG